MKRDLYQEITDTIIAELEHGTLPWLKPWRDGLGASIDPQMPRNAVSGRAYSGINVFLLWHAATTKAYQSGRWLTFKQAKESGGTVRAGEKGTMIIYFRKLSKQVRRDDGTAETVSIPLLRCYWVFNIAQCDGLPDRLTQGKPLPPAAELDSLFRTFVEKTSADIRHGGDRACYQILADIIQMPVQQAFNDVASYKATLLHEMTHWTGAASRCNREFGKRFGGDAYAFEELIAEIGAAFLCAHLGVKGELRHAGYIANWLTVLKKDKRAIFTAASQASKAADYLRAFSETQTAEETDDSEGEPLAIAA